VLSKRDLVALYDSSIYSSRQRPENVTEKHRIVVSAENSAYMAWQCKLLHHSCVTRLRHQPIFIVHAKGDTWDPGFDVLARAGAVVRRAPSYLCEKRMTTRNIIGTVLEAAPTLSAGEFMVLCDPDMIFARPADFPCQLAGNFHDYVDYNQEHVALAAQQFGVSYETVFQKGDQIRCGPPYVIPAVHAARLGKMWLDALDCFSIAGRPWESVWLDVMYAFGLAIAKLGWNVASIDVVDLDESRETPLQRPIVHYCLGYAGWDKRWFRSAEKAAEVWDSTIEAPEGTVAQELFSQIVEAREFYRKSCFDSPPANLRDSA